jgi:DeoR/GlpR family transcriptional regulator of sugar metabolism
MKLVELIDSGEYDYNDLDELAELFGVHPLTIRRDRAALAKDYGVCSHCGQLRPEFTEMMAAELS